MELTKLKTASKRFEVRIAKFECKDLPDSLRMYSLQRYIDLNSDLKCLPPEVESYLHEMFVKYDSQLLKSLSHSFLVANDNVGFEQSHIILGQKINLRWTNGFWTVSIVVKTTKVRATGELRETLLDIKVPSSRPIAIDLKNKVLVKFDINGHIQAIGELGILATLDDKDRKYFPKLISYDYLTGTTVFIPEKMIESAYDLQIKLKGLEYEKTFNQATGIIKELVEKYNLNDLSHYSMNNWAVVDRNGEFIPYVYDFGFLGRSNMPITEKRLKTLKTKIVGKSKIEFENALQSRLAA